MTGALVQGLARNFEDALRLLEAALSACPDELWATDLWPEEAPTALRAEGGLHGSAPWFLGYHALTCLDYDLAGDFEPWAPPAPFGDNTWSFPNRVFTQAEVLGYVAYCRGRVEAAMAVLTEASAGRPLPRTHRYAGTPYGVMISGIPLHVVEHAAQVGQWVAGRKR